MSTSLSVLNAHLPATGEDVLVKIKLLEEKIGDLKQIQFRTEHVFHAGMYARTIRIPPATAFISVLIKRATLLILRGTCDILCGERMIRFQGYNVIPADAGRKTVYFTRTAVELTMIFPSNAKTVEEAEAEFTDEAESLMSRTQENDIVVTEIP